MLDFQVNTMLSLNPFLLAYKNFTNKQNSLDDFTETHHTFFNACDFKNYMDNGQGCVTIGRNFHRLEMAFNILFQPIATLICEIHWITKRIKRVGMR